MDNQLAKRTVGSFVTGAEANSYGNQLCLWLVVLVFGNGTSCVIVCIIMNRDVTRDDYRYWE